MRKIEFSKENKMVNLEYRNGHFTIISNYPDGEIEKTEFPTIQSAIDYMRAIGYSIKL